MRALLLLCGLLLTSLGGRTFSLAEFFKRVEHNSMELIQKKATFISLLEEQKSTNSWDFPFISNETSVVRNYQGIAEPQPRTVLMIKPKLPWVSRLLARSLSIKNVQYRKSYELSRNLAFIGAKRLYLNYILNIEKHNIYAKREQIFYSQLNAAKAKVAAGSMSKKDYINFKNSYLESKLAKINMETLIINQERTLNTMLAIVDPIGQNARFSSFVDQEHQIKIPELKFEYVHLGEQALQRVLQHSLYVEVLDLAAKDYRVNANLANRDIFHDFEFGLGSESYNSATNLSMEFYIPLPVTPKNIHLKRKYLALENGTRAQNVVMKRNIHINANAYLDQLETKERYIKIQIDAIDNKAKLMEMGRVAYEAQKIGLFEYLFYQNAYMDALIALAEARIEYVNITALLEETLGQTLTHIGNAF
ncbi:TolC family protein [Helicobacter ailurogastricus]|uniref:Putative n=1 Tax=Helicobacter ailurogastricus TaxID=1578720 RepID=A0A0K2X633_9HELI|nr:TolC family protein [Helicobacter ailurogastricus]CRF41511.1 putative [Helicobacter ailurogastricus]CRF42979.1 putative [Helicobacter ailurogastricus]CRF43708.1 putative [Helicobacter ailurogastricus]